MGYRHYLNVIFTVLFFDEVDLSSFARTLIVRQKMTAKLELETSTLLLQANKRNAFRPQTLVTSKRNCGN